MKHEQSMVAMLKRHSFILALMLSLPLLFILISIYLTLQNYDRVISNVEDARTLKSTYVASLREESWLIVSGRKKPQEGKQARIIQEARNKINALMERSTPEAWVYLNAADRSIHTAEDYLDKLTEQIDAGMSARSNMKLYDEVSAVCRLTEDMLDHYIEQGNQDISDWNRRIQWAFIFLILMIFLLMTTAALLTFRISEKITQRIREPILELEAFAAKIAQGSLDSRVPKTSLPELKQLSRDLNGMAAKLKLYFEEKIEAESNLQKAELKALQAQIQPHFIYNTLGTIVWLAEQERAQDVVRMTMAFTKFLRLSLSGGKEIISVEKEVEHVKTYLDIQSFRYGQQLTYELDIDTRLLHLPMLKFILQPLVENAIYHGIKGKRFSRGHILIQGRWLDEASGSSFACFSVQDDGRGMSENRLTELRQSLTKLNETENSKWTVNSSVPSNTDLSQGGYGLQNVAQRLWLYHGCSLNIDSLPGEGCTVSFCFLLPSSSPAQNEESEASHSEAGI